MHWVAHIFLYCFCLTLMSGVKAAMHEIVRLEWEVRRVECKANGLDWVPSKDDPEIGYCRTPSAARERKGMQG